LTVLCILTFIGSGWDSLSALVSLTRYNPEALVEQLEEIAEQIEEIASLDGEVHALFGTLFPSPVGVLGAMEEYWFPIHGLSLLFSLLSVAGALLMFNLKRKGFFLYATAQVAALFVIPYFMGFPLLMMIGLNFSFVITLLFIILYAVNLKHME
jgi:hypothetical protein